MTLQETSCRIWHPSQQLKCKRCHDVGHRANHIDLCPAYINKQDNAIIFWRDTDILSNFYMCNVYMFKNNFKSVEHAYQWCKCTYFELYDLAEQVLNSKTPRQAKQITRVIAPELITLWNDEKKSCMFEVLSAKARSCKAFRDTLIRSNTSAIVEGTSDSFWGCMVAPPHSESCKISFMKGENQLGFMLMDLRRDLLDDLNDYCEHSSPTTSRAVSMDPMPSTSNSASSSTSCSTTKPFVTTALVTVPMSSSITESFNHTTYSTATVPALTNDVSVSSDSRNNTTFTPTTVNTASITTTIQPHVTSQSVTGPLCNTIITSADVHKSADDKTIPPCSDSPDLQAVSCIPLPEGDSFSCDTHIPPSTSTQAATRTNKPIVALSDKPEIKIKIKSKIPKSRANGSITSLDKTTPAKARIDNFFGAISSIKRKISPGKNADTVKDAKHTRHEI